MAELTPEYLKRMEDVLDTYERPFNPKEPVVCLDEKSLQLLKDSRPCQPIKPGKICKQDSEYVRLGTANVFCAVEPKIGRHFTRATGNRKKPEFAKMFSRIERAYPRANKIHLIVDNLNTHNEKTIVDYYGLKKGRRTWNRFIVHYTPKHGSWLNQAEIEIGLFSRQCLGKSRVGSLEELKFRTRAWNKIANKKKVKINWKFTSTKARKLFRYKNKDKY